MRKTTVSRELIWLAAVSLVLIVGLWTAVYFQKGPDPTAQLAAQSKRLAAVSAMRLALAAVSEAHNSLIMATTEQDLGTFAEQARKSATALEQERTQLEQLVNERGDPRELELLARVIQDLDTFQKIDAQLMDVAIQNTNRQAYSLAVGPSMNLLREIDATLAGVASEQAQSKAPDSRQVLQHTSDARIGILRMQLLLLPHIAEASDEEMDKFEAQLAQEDQQVRDALDSLAKLLPPGDSSPLSMAAARYAEFGELKARIIRLSRANTNIRAATIALTDKRKAMLACQDSLAALEHVVRAEPIVSNIPSHR